MKLQYLRAFIVLLAGLITLIVNMKTGKPVVLSLFIVLIVLLVFYVIGTLAVELLQKSLDEQNEENMEQSEDENSTAMDENGEVEGMQQNEDAVAFSFDEDE